MIHDRQGMACVSHHPCFATVREGGRRRKPTLWLRQDWSNKSLEERRTGELLQDGKETVWLNGALFVPRTGRGLLRQLLCSGMSRNSRHLFVLACRVVAADQPAGESIAHGPWMA